MTNAEIAARLFISRLIGDITVFTVETSGPALAASVSAMGNPARWVWAGTGEIPPGEVVMEMTSKKSWPVPGGLFLEYSKILQMRGRELDRYLIELAEQKTWIEGAKFHAGRPRHSDHRNHAVLARRLQDYLRGRNASARHPDVLATQRRERARVRSEREHRWAGLKPRQRDEPGGRSCHRAAGRRGRGRDRGWRMDCAAPAPQDYGQGQ